MKKIKFWMAISLVIIILMGATLGGSIVTFIIFLTRAPIAGDIPQNVILLSIISYALLAIFALLVVALGFTLAKYRQLGIQKQIDEGK